MQTLTNQLFRQISDLNEGWGIYHSLGDKGWEYRIERHDCQRLFPNDMEAVQHIVRRALEGSEVHREALEFMINEGSSDELKFILKSIIH